MKKDIRGFIGTGKSAAVSRSELCKRTGWTDRQVRLAIQDAKTDTVIINTGNGYYIPTKDEAAELKAYIDEETARAKQILRGLMRYTRLYSDYQYGRIK